MPRDPRPSFPSRIAILAVAAAVAIPGCLPRSEEPRDPADAERAVPEDRALAPSGRPYSEDRAPCASRDPLRQAFWGELHVHSALSMDAWLWDVRGGPDDVYRFAQGESIELPAPAGSAGSPRPVRLERPLDFAALTDHASYQGEVALCTRPGSPVYESEGCRIYRAETGAPESPMGGFAARMAAIARSLDPRAWNPARHPDVCGEDGERCRTAMREVWEEQQAAAERHYDRTPACRFTTLHGYEYTATPGLTKIHHNVIFRNARVPAAPIPWVDEPDVYGLWRKLRDQCLEAGTGCDVITIPHNSNLSNGRMFTVTGKDLPLETQRARALLRADIERLVEVTQIKGDSECRNGMYQVVGAPDEFCAYEEWRGPDIEDCEEGVGAGALGDRGCVSRTDYVRYALIEGLRERERIGVNPYKLGMIAATDQHNANPGDVEEYSYSGWQGSQDASPALRLEAGEGTINAANSLASNPGGLAAVWAEENSRDAIFDAMKRRETFATSGPRMTARFYGGWDYPTDLCERGSLVETGYAGGVPMGGDLAAPPADAAAPTFVVSAMRDPGISGHPGGRLQRVQIVKGWIDDAGRFHQRVHDVAGGPNGASVDPATCEPRGPGHDTLCSVWKDPDFDPSRDAVYYVRVLENPSCRWSQRQCLELPAAERPASCSDPSIPRVIQERLWTSPIWYAAEAGERTS